MSNNFFRNLKTNKKGVLAIIAVVGILAVIITLVLAQQKPYQLTIEIGDMQRSGLNLYSEAQFIRDYMERSAELALTQTAGSLGSLNSDQLEDQTIERFEHYLKAYPSDPGQPISDGTLYDIFSFKYKITTNPLTFQAFPQSKTLEIPIVDETGKATFESVTIPSVIELENEEYDMTYRANAYVGIFLDKNLDDFITN